MSECPVCKTLNREHGIECEIEASAILRQRSSWLGHARHHDVPQSEDLDNIISSSRKRQMRIAAELRKHKSDSHAA